MSKRVRQAWYVEGVLTDVTSIVLSDPTGTYGAKRDDTDAVVVADGTAIPKVSTGVYEYEFAEPAAGLAYTAYAEIVYNGQTYYIEHDFPAVSSSVSAEITRDSLRIQVGDWLGIGRSSWGVTDDARLDEIIASGARQMYFPPPLAGERVSHRWSFLRPVAEMDTVVSQGDYDLPSDFGGLVGGRIYYSEDDSVWHPITEVGVGGILHARQFDLADGPPVSFCVAPAASSGSASQGWILSLVPAADAIYTLKYQYQILPEAIDSAHTYHLGNAIHSETLLASCLAVAERRFRQGETSQQSYWQERLAASVMYDRRMAPGSLGYNGDRSRARIRLERHNYVTVGGVLYDNR